jgi:hypothetical protein
METTCSFWEWYLYTKLHGVTSQETYIVLVFIDKVASLKRIILPTEDCCYHREPSHHGITIYGTVVMYTSVCRQLVIRTSVAMRFLLMEKEVGVT